MHGNVSFLEIDEAGFGQFSFCRDPQGIPFGLHQRPQTQ